MIYNQTFVRHCTLSHNANTRHVVVASEILENVCSVLLHAWYLHCVTNIF